MKHRETLVDKVAVSAYTIPTDAPEGDGTFKWDSTTLVLCEIFAGGKAGVGYTYGNKATALVADELATKCIFHQSSLDIPAMHASMVSQVRNDGSRGIASMAISALDIALWDVKAQILNCSVLNLIGSAQQGVQVYGSGGFTTYDNGRLATQLSGWVDLGFKSVKMKIGAYPDADLDRVKVAREVIGAKTNLFVDANGAYSSRQAISFAQQFAEYNVIWFEEPVSSDRLADLRRIRDRAPNAMEVAAGEYGYDSLYFRHMLEAKAIDVLQLDATRCKGFTGFLEGAAIARSFGCPLSAHCAPSLHMHVGCSVPKFRNIEFFHDHARIEKMLFDGFIHPKDGELRPDQSRAGLGLVFKERDAERFLAWRNR